MCAAGLSAAALGRSSGASGPDEGVIQRRSGRLAHVPPVDYWPKSEDEDEGEDEDARKAEGGTSGEWRGVGKGGVVVGRAPRAVGR